MSLLDEIRIGGSSEYLSYASQFPAEQAIGDFVLIYGQSSLEVRNRTYDVQSNLPGWFSIGDDGGGRALLMRLDGSHAVYICGHGVIGVLEPERISHSFRDWVAGDCSMPEE